MEQYNSCGVLMKQIHDALEKNANNTLRKLDLTFSQIEVLLILQNFFKAIRETASFSTIYYCWDCNTIRKERLCNSFFRRF